MLLIPRSSWGFMPCGEAKAAEPPGAVGAPEAHMSQELPSGGEFLTYQYWIPAPLVQVSCNTDAGILPHKCGFSVAQIHTSYRSNAAFLSYRREFPCPTNAGFRRHGHGPPAARMPNSFHTDADFLPRGRGLVASLIRTSCQTDADLLP